MGQWPTKPPLFAKHCLGTFKRTSRKYDSKKILIQTSVFSSALDIAVMRNTQQ